MTSASAFSASRNNRLGRYQTRGAGGYDIAGNTRSVTGNIHTLDPGFEVAAGFNLGGKKP